MRLFPRTARRRWAAVTAAVALTACALSVPSSSLWANADDLKDRQKKVRKHIHSANEDLEDSSRAVRRATARLDAAQAELDAARNHLDRVRGRLDAARAEDRRMKLALQAAEEKLARAEDDLDQGRIALGEQQDAVTDVVNSIYQQGDPQLMAFASLLNARTTADLTRQVEANDALVGRESHAYDDLRAAEVLLEVREKQVQEAKDEVAVQRADAAEHLVRMQGLRNEAVETRDQVRQLVDDRRGLRQKAAQARQRDRAQLQQLREQERRIKQEILERARRASGGFNGRTGGFLNRPVPGGVTSPFGMRRHPIYGYWGLHNGTDFSTGCGTPLYASSGGKVISRYYSPVYGNRLFVGVGLVNGRYLTLVYNHLSGYNVGAGANVNRGEVVGYAGTTGWSTACHLHFTVMANGRPVNPMNYM
ncbi:MAG: peptidoglycan DD-metalloendopeptidase family protein [Nocardioides sp.]